MSICQNISKLVCKVIVPILITMRLLSSSLVYIFSTHGVISVLIFVNLSVVSEYGHCYKYISYLLANRVSYFIFIEQVILFVRYSFLPIFYWLSYFKLHCSFYVAYYRFPPSSCLANNNCLECIVIKSG